MVEVDGLGDDGQLGRNNVVWCGLIRSQHGILAHIGLVDVARIFAHTQAIGLHKYNYEASTNMKCFHSRHR